MCYALLGMDTTATSIDILSYTLTPVPRSYDNLEKILGKQRRIDYITPDGNCLFRSLSKEILGHQKFHRLIRQYILEFMKENVG